MTTEYQNHEDAEGYWKIVDDYNVKTILLWLLVIIIVVIALRYWGLTWFASLAIAVVIAWLVIVATFNNPERTEDYNISHTFVNVLGIISFLIMGIYIILRGFNDRAEPCLDNKNQGITLNLVNSEPVSVTADPNPV